MVEWSLQADDLYAGVMVVDLFLDQFRIALSDDFRHLRAGRGRPATLLTRLAQPAKPHPGWSLYGAQRSQTLAND
jgi:hypothetical protein